MKHALNKNGILIEARDSAPGEANCPHCGGRMVLRRRRRMGYKGVTFFWRHLDNRDRHCPRRARPAR